ncbi:conjugative transposon protein TraN [Pedobacter insulae]|uniref:Bacteroides conjugative transposon TraN protein n=1 Tax=Pedobacter insulae TaxID=414048 RepID=A0A1I2ZJF7_9SPHI|nr:conjugative transposon protein TraN [Pedobacter insulae]SFH38002.1 Bacteroides conjugative transposon TraN protein [Pedobacter insulae]
MKNFKSLLAFAVVLFTLHGNAQELTFATDTKSRIEPLQLAISYQKTTNLIFPYAIKSVDRGSAEVLVQKAKGVENVLQLKAAKDSFKETNLSIITADGSLYSFVLHFAQQPTTLNLELADKPMGYEPVAIFTREHDNQQKILTASEYVSGKLKSIRGPRDNKFSVGMGLNGLYIKDNIMYYQLELRNKSNISYDIEQLRFFIRDKKKSKRTASQELEQTPLHIHGNVTILHQQSTQYLVIALQKFTIPDKKELIIQLMEKNGGRHLTLRLNNKHLMRSVSF